MDFPGLSNHPNPEEFSTLERIRKRFALHDHWCDWVIAGGAIRDLIFGKRRKDIDIFMYGAGSKFLNPLKAYSTWVEWLTDLNENFFTSPLLLKITGRPLLIERFEWGLEQRYFVVKLAEGYVTTDLGTTEHVQVLWYPHAQTVDEVLEKFDLDICRFAYDGNQIILGPDVNLKSVTRAMTAGGPARHLGPVSSANRLNRFEAKYSVDVSESREKLKQFEQTFTDEQKRQASAYYFQMDGLTPIGDTYADVPTYSEIGHFREFNNVLDFS